VGGWGLWRERLILHTRTHTHALNHTRDTRHAHVRAPPPFSLLSCSLCPPLRLSSQVATQHAEVRDCPRYGAGYGSVAGSRGIESRMCGGWGGGRRDGESEAGVYQTIRVASHRFRALRACRGQLSVSAGGLIKGGWRVGRCPTSCPRASSPRPPTNRPPPPSLP
jgi:hypothetical protein